MSYSGYMLKINGTIFPNRLIGLESYKCTPDQIMDLDPYRDADGLLHRNSLPHTATSIEFSTPYLRQRDVNTLNTFLSQSNRVKCNIEYYNHNTGDYASGDFYIADVAYEPVNVDDVKNIILLYKPIKVTITEY